MTPPRKLSVLAVLSVVFSFIIPPLGVILGVVALVRIADSQGRKRGRNAAVAGIVLGLVMTGVFHVVRGEFARFQCKAMQSEAKVGLKMMYVNYVAQAKDTVTLEEMGVPPARRYTFRASSEPGFIAEAESSAPELTGDLWRIKKNGQVENVRNGCDP